MVDCSEVVVLCISNGRKVSLQALNVQRFCSYAFLVC